MILNKIILIYGVALDGTPRKSYFLASILFLTSNVLSCPRSIKLCENFFFENFHVLPEKTANFRSLLPVNQLNWTKQNSFPCQTFTLVHDTKTVCQYLFHYKKSTLNIFCSKYPAYRKIYTD